MPDFRLWRCPGCAETYRVHPQRDDPLVCAKCTAAQPREITEFVDRPTSPGGMRTKLLYGIGLAAFLLLLLGIVSVGSRDASGPANRHTSLPSTSGRQSAPPARTQPVADNATSNLIGAHVSAKQFCESRLRSPGSAKHPWASYRGTTTALGNYRYRVTSYVDSQNAFGALLRSHYTCVVRDNGGGTFELESFQFR